MTKLFEPMQIRDTTLQHRIVIPPMAMYSATPEGCATDWHLVHYGRLAMGGAAMVVVESTAVEDRGRIGYACLGLYDDRQIDPLRRVASAIRSQGSVPAIQLNHTGRKGSWRRPWDGYCALTEDDIHLRSEAPWEVISPSPIPLSPERENPHEMSEEDIRQNIELWCDAARRADVAGFEVLEIHAAHGYLVHQFLSPLSNQREDSYGGDLQRRMRFALELVEALRSVWPASKPLFVRLSAVDGKDGGWTLDDSVKLSRELVARGVDVIDCSSGGLGGSATNARIPRGPGYQIPFAQRIRTDTGALTMGVGLITTPEQAAEVIDHERADLVAIGREALVSPNWADLARTRLDPGAGYSEWHDQFGWWLDKREQSLQASQ